MGISFCRLSEIAVSDPRNEKLPIEAILRQYQYRNLRRWSGKVCVRLIALTDRVIRFIPMHNSMIIRDQSEKTTDRLGACSASVLFHLRFHVFLPLCFAVPH